MKIRKEVYLEKLEDYGYQYKENLFYPTYQKRRSFGNGTILLEILVYNRTIYINKSPHITEKNKRYLLDLIEDHLVEPEKKV